MLKIIGIIAMVIGLLMVIALILKLIAVWGSWKIMTKGMKDMEKWQEDMWNDDTWRRQ